MRNIFALVALCTLVVGCTHNPNTPLSSTSANQPMQISAGDAAVVIGTSITHPQTDPILNNPYNTPIGWVATDPKTGLRVGTQWFGTGVACRIFDCKEAAGERPYYTLMMLPAGTYSLAWVAQHFSVFEVTRFESLGIMTTGQSQDSVPFNPSLAGRASPVAPSFTVQPGEVAYVGTLTLDFSVEDVVRWSHSYDDAGAKAFLGPTGLAGQMVRERMTRANGQPIGQWDAISNKKN